MTDYPQVQSSIQLRLSEAHYVEEVKTEGKGKGLKTTYVYHPICHWCQKQKLLPKPEKRKFGLLCSQGCIDDHAINSYPSWMTGRIGLPPPQGIRTLFGFKALSAPNKYRSAIRRRDWTPDVTLAMQKEDYPDEKNPLGLDFDPVTWDLVLIWR